MQPYELVRLVKEAAGLPVSDGLDSPPADESAETSSVDLATTEELEVRPLLARGEEPFKVIMAAVARVPDHGALRLRTSFEPAPRTPEDAQPPRCARANCQPAEESDS